MDNITILSTGIVPSPLKTASHQTMQQLPDSAMEIARAFDSSSAVTQR